MAVAPAPTRNHLSTTQIFHGLMVLVLPLGLLCAWHAFRQGRSIPCLPLADRINPNHATLPALMSLPGIGPARAQTIVAYRQEQQGSAESPVFTCPEDMTAVPGLGPVTAQRLAPFLIFTSGQMHPDGENALAGTADSIIMRPN